MTVVQLVLGFVGMVGLMVTATDDFGAIEADRATAAFVADSEAGRLLDDFDQFADYGDLEAWLTVDPHVGVAEMDWCVRLPDPIDPGSRLTVMLDYTVHGSADRELLRGEGADGSARRFVTAPAHQAWPAGWQSAAAGAVCA